MNKFYTMFLASVATIGMLDASSTVSNASFASLLQNYQTAPTSQNFIALQNQLSSDITQFNQLRVNMTNVVLPQADQSETSSVSVTGVTPLIYAIITNGANTNYESASFQAIVNLLPFVERSILDTAIDGSYGLNALMWAIYYQNAPVVQRLLSIGANPRAVVSQINYDGLFANTPARKLMGLSLNGPAAVPTLPDGGMVASISPFIVLAMSATDSADAEEIAAMLYQANPQVVNDITDGIKMTALMFMSANAMTNLLSYLNKIPGFTAGNKAVQNSNGFTAYDIANLANQEYGWISRKYGNSMPTYQDYQVAGTELKNLH